MIYNRTDDVVVEKQIKTYQWSPCIVDLGHLVFAYSYEVGKGMLHVSYLNAAALELE